MKIEDANVKLATEFDASKIHHSSEFVVGDNSKAVSKLFNKTTCNEPLMSATYYYITIYLMNDFKSKRRYAVYRIASHTEGVDMQPSGSTAGLYALLLLLVVPGIVAWIVVK